MIGLQNCDHNITAKLIKRLITNTVSSCKRGEHSCEYVYSAFVGKASGAEASAFCCDLI